jgi:hypothetical protein
MNRKFSLQECWEIKKVAIAGQDDAALRGIAVSLVAAIRGEQ